MTPEEGEYEPVMPFVVCKTAGGPLDDHAFIAGATFGQHAAELESAARTLVWAAYVYPEMVPQYDLLAMHHGFTMKAEPWDEHPDEWVLVTLTKGREEPDAEH